MNVYQILGVDRNATQEQIKIAYRKLAMRFHPDRNKVDSENIKKINEAYRILGNPTRRQEYDRTHGIINFQDLRQTAKPEIIHLHHSITMQQAFTGMDLVLTINQKSIAVKIPPGIQDRTVIKCVGVENGGTQNIFLTINISKDDTFAREGDHLITEAEISFLDLILGGSISVKTIDGRALTIPIRPDTDQDVIITVNNEGMPYLNDPGRRGNLLIVLKPVIPADIPEDAKELLKQARNLI